MIQDIQRLLDDYHPWFKSRTSPRQINKWVEITTPYLDRHNYYRQIYVERVDGGFVLTGDGYTVEIWSRPDASSKAEGGRIFCQ